MNLLLSFIFYFVLGTVIYFIHTTGCVAICLLHYSSMFHLDEKTLEQKAVQYLGKILFQTIIMSSFPITFGIYSYISTTYSNYNFISSGLFTIIWLLATGIIIRFLYYIFTIKIGLFKTLNFQHYKVNNDFFWVMCPVLYGIILQFYDSKSLYIIIAIVLGKFIWMDSKVLFPFSIKQIVDNLKKYRVDLKLLLFQASIMLYLTLRWYPIKDKVFQGYYTGITFFMLCFYLMPIFDICIYDEIKKHIKIQEE